MLAVSVPIADIVPCVGTPLNLNPPEISKSFFDLKDAILAPENVTENGSPAAVPLKIAVPGTSNCFAFLRVNLSLSSDRQLTP